MIQLEKWPKNSFGERVSRLLNDAPTTLINKRRFSLNRFMHFFCCNFRVDGSIAKLPRLWNRILSYEKTKSKLKVASDVWEPIHLKARSNKIVFDMEIMSKQKLSWKLSVFKISSRRLLTRQSIKLKEKKKSWIYTKNIFLPS